MITWIYVGLWTFVDFTYRWFLFGAVHELFTKLYFLVFLSKHHFTRCKFTLVPFWKRANKGLWQIVLKMKKTRKIFPSYESFIFFCKKTYESQAYLLRKSSTKQVALHLMKSVFDAYTSNLFSDLQSPFLIVCFFRPL